MSGTPSNFTDAQRLAFGRAAELYDEVRPGYPDAVMDSAIALAGVRAGDRVFEVGAGTGKATGALARRGLEVLAIEPSPEMAAVARRNLARLGCVTIAETDFERWIPAEERAALFSFQAWHWTDPGSRYRLAHRALTPGGRLAAIWTFPEWANSELRPALSAAYESAAPGLEADFPMHPSSVPTALAGDWAIECCAAGLFQQPAIEMRRWSKPYGSQEYVQLLQTHQDHILLDERIRRRLLGAVQTVIDSAGGTIELQLETYICTATCSRK